MSDKAHYRKLENMYNNALCNEYFQAKIAISEAKAEVTIPVKASLLHPGGVVHGSVYFKALDDAAFFSANSLVEDVVLSTANFNIYFTRPVSSGKIKAAGKVVNSTKSLFIAESVLYDSENREIARGIGSFVRSKAALTKELGYK